jgi:predicted DNA-binding antitoxin AbrB/MazE fold protein
MSITVEAVYENGVLRPIEALPLGEHDRVRVTVHMPNELPDTSDVVEGSYGLVKWPGDATTLDRLIMDAEFGPEEG